MQGDVQNGVLSMEVERKDIGDVQGPLGAVFTPSFEIHGDLHFQPIAQGALLNGDMALKDTEVNPFIAVLSLKGLVFQAYHQHMIMMTPQIWFVHFRGVGDPLDLARAVRAAINTTSTPLPQAPPKNPPLVLDPNRLASILHGTATVGDEGVVSVTVDRTDLITLQGICVNPDAGISTTIEFRQIAPGRTSANVMVDFSMTSDEVQPVVDLMLLHLGWFQGCLYNQETAEEPQLYFDHMLKSADAYVLAAEIRQGLDLTKSK